MTLASFSESSCLEVVPEPIREWKPDTAPQATVMNRVGNRVVPVTPFQPTKAGSSTVMLEPKIPTTATIIIP